MNREPAAMSAMADWRIHDVRIAGVSFTETGAASVSLGWVAVDADGKMAGSGELTIQRLDGWIIDAEARGPELAKKVLAYIVDNGKIIE